MPTIGVNPNGCCATCAEVPDCMSCDDGMSSTMKLNITISGAPGTSGLCECPEHLHVQRRILWSNLNGSFQLEQDSPGLCFGIDLVGDCEDVRDSDAILIEDEEFGCCDEVGLRRQWETYVSGVEACIECVGDRMEVSSVSFSFCRCERQKEGDPPEWGPWICTDLQNYPEFPGSFTCGIGENITTAVPCTSQQMQRELLWATPTNTSPCTFIFPCDEPTVGTLGANLSCD
jgi:hypothetical protein